MSDTDLTTGIESEGLPPEIPENLPIRVERLSHIQPYWRNPRRIPESSIEAVIDSIQKYGYQQPIVVDEKNVIIVGHTRYAALQRLGVERVPVIESHLPPKLAKEYRIMDNRAGEDSAWDFPTLLLELREVDPTLQANWFPEIDLSDDFSDDNLDVTDEDTEEADEDVTDVGHADQPVLKEITCPHCGEPFEVNVRDMK